MLTRLRFTVDGSDFYARAFETYAHEADDMREPLGEIAAIIRTSVGEQFATEGGHGGAGWQPLSSSYKIWKDLNYPGRPMLVRTGDMRGAALSPQAFTITRDRLTYEVDDPKAIYHQRGEGHMPRRPLVAITLAERREFDRSFVSWINAVRHGVIGRAA